MELRVDKSATNPAMRARCSIWLMAGCLLLTNGISIRFVSGSLTSAYHREALEKRRLVASRSIVFSTDIDRGTAVNALFEVEKEIALSSYAGNLIAIANLFIFVGTLLCTSDVLKNMTTKSSGSMAFQGYELSDVLQILDRLKKQADPVAALLWQKLSIREQSLLMDCENSGVNLEDAKSILVRALNKTLTESCIYDVNRFGGVTLRAETTDLLKRELSGINTVYINRLLLEDAFPRELKKMNGKSQPIAHGVP